MDLFKDLNLGLGGLGRGGSTGGVQLGGRGGATWARGGAFGVQGGWTLPHTPPVDPPLFLPFIYV